jgi:D-sedoheptulose 7-phosphate isomerase
MSQGTIAKELILNYSSRLQEVLAKADWTGVSLLSQDMLQCWQEKRRVFFCGNGGSAGNAIHLANDFLYGIAKKTGGGLKVQALSANPAVLTCLANDVGYDFIYSEQLAVQAQSGDLLIAMSGSGNSPNIIRVIEQAKVMGVKSYAILGFTGGKCKELADISLHFPVSDMQISEDLQLIVGHMIMQYLSFNSAR